MLEAGHSKRHVAGVPGVSQSYVGRMLERFQTHGNVRYRHDAGRERVTTEREGRFIVVQVQSQSFIAATALQNDLQNALGVRISTQTIRNRLHRASKRAK